MVKGKIIIAVGLAGVGKSTVLRKLEDLVSKDKSKVKIVSYGSIMTERAKKLGMTDDRDKLRRSSVNKQKALQEYAAKEISTLAYRWDFVIVDTHMIISTDKGYLPALPYNILLILKPSLLVVIEAEPEIILSRRTGDVERNRDQTSMKQLLAEMAFSRSVAAACSVITGAPAKFIENINGKQDVAADQFLKLLEGS
jgi:adenylate kinase